MNSTKLDGLSSFEQAVLDKLLSGDNPVLRALRLQASQSQVTKREFTGIGFYCEFEVERATLSVRANFEIGDVLAAIPGLAHGAGFLLFIRNGRIKTLEGYTYDEPWPNQLEGFALSYIDPVRKVQLEKIEQAM